MILYRACLLFPSLRPRLDFVLNSHPFSPPSIPTFQWQGEFNIPQHKTGDLASGAEDQTVFLRLQLRAVVHLGADWEKGPGYCGVGAFTCKHTLTPGLCVFSPVSLWL